MVHTLPKTSPVVVPMFPRDNPGFSIPQTRGWGSGGRGVGGTTLPQPAGVHIYQKKLLFLLGSLGNLKKGDFVGLPLNNTHPSQTLSKYWLQACIFRILL